MEPDPCDSHDPYTEAAFHSEPRFSPAHTAYLYQYRCAADLQELAESIAEIGIIQPITLRKLSDDEYQIIAGERRFRASQIAGLTSIPAYIRTADDENVMEMALIENIQREDLNSVEIALAYQHLLEGSGR